MKAGVPVAVAVMALIAFSAIYYITTAGRHGGNELTVVNSVGLVAVFVGVVAAGLILRRASPPQ